MQKLLSDKKDSLLALGCLITVILAFAKLDTVTLAMRDALALCASSIIPSLFPFLVLTSLLLSSTRAVSLLSLLASPFSRLFGVTRKGAIAYLFGTLLGFPIGAQIVAEGVAQGEISYEEGERLLLFSCNTGPSFLIGGVGLGMLGSLKEGIFLFLLQLAVSAATGILTKKQGPRRVDQAVSARRKSFTAITRDATLQMLAICGYILFFSVLSALVTSSLFFANAPFSALVYSFLELGSGCAFSSRLAFPFSLAFCGFSACFSGLSVYFQCRDAIRDTTLTMRYYFPIKLLCGIVAFTVCILVSFFG